MGCVASLCASTACSCCIGASCTCFGCMVTISKSAASRVWYAVIFFFMSVLAWILKYDMLSPIPYIGCDDSSGSCAAYYVYKTLFPLVVFHTVMAVILLGVKDSRDVRSTLQDRWWAIKFLLIFVLFTGSLFIPNSFFEVIGWIYLFGAGFFILIQLFLLIAFAYDINESWGEKFESGRKEYFWFGIVTVVVFYLAVLGLDGLMFGLFFDCWYIPFVAALGLVAVLVISLLPFLPAIQRINPSIGLLQGAVVSLYITYLFWSATLSVPESEGCFVLSDNLTSGGWITIIGGAIFTVASVLYSSLRVGSSSAADFEGADTENLLRATEPPELKSSSSKKHDNDNDDDDEALQPEVSSLPVLDDEKPTDDEMYGTKYSYSGFHIAFSLGAMFVAMLLTNWGVVYDDTSDATGSTDMGWFSVGVKLTSCVIGIGMYVWTVFAPACFPNREF